MDDAETKKHKRKSVESTSDIDFHCRCGETGYGHVDDAAKSQRAIMCDECHKWSHLACAQGIQHPDASFVCHHCVSHKSAATDHGLKLRRSNRM